MTKTRVEKKKSKNNWECEDCGATFKSKKMLIEHLKEDFIDGQTAVDVCGSQLEELGVNLW